MRPLESSLTIFASACCVLAVGTAWGQAAVPSVLAGADGAGLAEHDVYLAVNINGQSTAQIARFHEVQGKLSATANDLAELGILVEKRGLSGWASVALDSVRGLRYRYDVATQTVELQVPDDIRKPYRFDARDLAPVPAATSSRGLVFNYDAFAQWDRSGSLSVWGEQRYFDQSGVFSNTGVAALQGQGRRYVRFDTSWTTSDPDALTTTRFGDTITSSLEWSRSTRIGGLQWSRNFSLRPDLVTFPVPILTGSAVVPSSVELYVNNVKQYGSNVPEGPFVINGAPGISGAGQATVLTRDALGRTVQTSVPFYVDTRMLAAGLSSFSIEAGFVRRAYGVESFDYSRRPAASASLRYGISDKLTVELHAEATSGLQNVGAGALARLGTAGVVNASVGGSAGRLAGAQVGLGYQFVGQRFSIDMHTQRTLGNYGDLAAREGAAVPSVLDRVTVSLPLFSRKSLGLSYVGFRLPGAAASRIGSVSFTQGVGNIGSLMVSAYRDFAQHHDEGVFLSASVDLGNNASLTTTASRQNGQVGYQVGAMRAPDYGGGWGWGAQAGGAAASRYGQAQGQYLGRYGEATAVAQRAGRRVGASLDLSGAVVAMDGHLLPSRRIDDSFAVVSTRGVAGVPVLHENRVIGKTDRSGYLLIPDLNAYQHNRVSIDSMNLPADARIETTSMDVVPKMHAGFLATFGVSRYHAASVILTAEDGKVLPPGVRVHHVESGADTIVGYDGMTFIEHLQHENHLVIDRDGMTCRASFVYEGAPDGTLPTLGPLTCAAFQAASR